MVTTPNILADAESRMKKAVEALRREMSTVRTGRANPTLVEHLQVDYQGVSMPLNQLASITAPEARLLVVQPWDRQTLAWIEKAVLRSDLGITPVNDGAVLRLALPILTEERRRQLGRLVKAKTEEGRIAVRNVRRDAVDRVREMEKSKEISQDDSRRATDRLQRLTDTFTGQMDQLLETKEAEVMEG